VTKQNELQLAAMITDLWSFLSYKVVTLIHFTLGKLPKEIPFKMPFITYFICAIFWLPKLFPNIFVEQYI